MEIEKPQPPKRPRIPYEIRLRIIGFLEAGKSQREASSHFKKSRSAIQNIWEKFQKTKTAKSKKRVGRPQIIDEQKRIEIASHLSEPYTSLKIVSIEHEVSKTQSHRIAKEFGLEYKYFNEKYHLNEASAQKRLTFAQTWDKNSNLSKIIYCDESYIHIFRNTLGSGTAERKIIIEKINPNYALMVFAAISLAGKSEIIVCKKGFKINSETYIEILQSILIPFIEKFHKDDYFVLQDNARSHISKKTFNGIKEKQLKMIENYPPYSPDFNAIEGVGKI